MTDDERHAALRFDKDVYEVACVLATSAPLDLNQFHFDQLRIISKSSETRAREAQRQAQLAIVHARTAPAQTKAVPAAPDDMAAFLQTHGKHPATYEALYEVFEALRDAWDATNEKNIVRNNRLAELETRVLDLEAQRVMAHADH